MATALAPKRIKIKPRKAADLHLACILALSDAAPAVQCRPVRLQNGVPVYRFRKQVIRLGNFTTADGQSFEVTPETLRLWLSDFRRMKSNKVPVSIPDYHDAMAPSGAIKANANHGFVVDLKLSNDGQGLDAIMELYGKDAPRLAASNDCSIYADPGWEDSSGNRYEWPIRHVALTPDPRITGLKGFVPLAASNHQSIQVPIARTRRMAKRRLKLDDNPMSVPGTGYGESPANGEGVEGDPLDMILDAIENESLPKIREAKDKPTRVKLAKEMAAKIDRAMELFVEDEEADDEPAGETEGEPKPKEAELSNDGGKWCEIEQNVKKRSKAAMSNAPATLTIHPELVRLSNQNRTMQIDRLFAEHKITAHQRKELLAKFTGAGPVKMALSNTAAAATFEQTLEILGQNQPTRQAEKSGWQTLDDPLKLSNDPGKDPETSAALKFMHDQIGMKTA